MNAVFTLFAACLLVGSEAFAVVAAALWPIVDRFGAAGRLLDFGVAGAAGLAAAFFLARRALSLQPERLEDE